MPPHGHQDQFAGRPPLLNHQHAIQNMDPNFNMTNNGVSYNACPPPGHQAHNNQNRFMPPQMNQGMMSNQSGSGQFFEGPNNQQQPLHQQNQFPPQANVPFGRGPGQFQQPLSSQAAPWHPQQSGPHGDGPRPSFQPNQMQRPRTPAGSLLPTPPRPAMGGLLPSPPRFRAQFPQSNQPVRPNFKGRADFGQKRRMDTPHSSTNGKVLKLVHSSTAEPNNKTLTGQTISDTKRMANLKLANAKQHMVKKANVVKPTPSVPMNVKTLPVSESKLSTPSGVVVDDDYNKRLEAQKKAREEIIRKKEERRKQMAREKITSAS
jgi:hypothetical protein